MRSLSTQRGKVLVAGGTRGTRAKRGRVRYDVAVVGGGIVGLATSRELLRRFPGLRLANVEKEAAPYQHQSGHNSGVIHSGIYYKPGSLKAKLCVEGRRLLWSYCDEKAIPYKAVGKLIVATEDEELPRLRDLYARGQQNGVEGLALVDAAQIEEREPHCRGIQAIFSPVTGIVDFRVVAQHYADDVRTLGGELFLSHEVTGFARRNATTQLQSPAGDIEARAVITCAGLYSDKLARMTGGERDPKIVPFRGDYLILRPEKRYLVKGNIYPVPDPQFPFLGVHFTPRMDGDIWLGPNAVLAFAREGYRFFDVNPRELLDAISYPGFLRLATKYWQTGAGEMLRDVSRTAYVKALQRYIPELEPNDCLPGPSGVRAQAMSASGELIDDFVFDGADGIVHVRNAPSPGATSSLAIARYIADEAARRFNLSTGSKIAT
ncbi:MAG: L-2-hydroxyglutarate oxidase [Candidatus Eremiobacteraeota bacterium]|nr:L-2-hydroxyglutarate oxidase [Candidatus Eremiobacteraeota bacterium]